VKFKIDIDSAERQVEAAADGSLVIDGKSFKAKVSGSGSSKRTVQVGDKTYEVLIVKQAEAKDGTPSEYVLEVAGERVPVTVKEVANTAPQAVAAGAAPAEAAAPAAKVAEGYKDGIFAPVPGKIVDIKVKVGDTVKEGDLVLILEAMKMENELHSPKQATVAAVLVNRGDQTTKGQLLVAFE
jgi:biotin carboxyl carrier protein